MTDALADVLRAFRAAGVAADPEGVADAAWLARWLPAAPEPLRPVVPPHIAPPPPEEREKPEEQQEEEPIVPEKPVGKPAAPAGAGDAVGLSLPNAGAGRDGGAAGRTFWAPAAPALARPRELARALRPLVRKVPSRVRFVLDEAETIRRLAETRVCDPGRRPERERWLSLALVLDTGTGAELWKDTFEEFRGLLAALGAFRDVRPWRLDTDARPPRLLPGDRPRPGETSRHPRELIDPTGRTLVVVLSACVTAAWQDGSAAAKLSEWGKRGPVVLVPLLPESMWPRTALGRATLVRVSAAEPGAAGRRLRAELPDAWPGDEPPPGVPVPVAVLEPASLARWAGCAAARPGATAPALILDTSPAPAPATPAAKPDGLARVEKFRRVSSPLARRLAGLLAAAPVINLPILRLIRQAMLPAAGQPQEAEVLFGGLLTRAPGDDPDPRFTFLPGAREALLDAAPTDESLKVLAAVSDYLGEHLASGRTFRSVFADPSAAAGEVVPADGPFAQVAAEVLARAGGDYARMVRRTPLPARGGPGAGESSQAPLRRERPPEPERGGAADEPTIPPLRRAAALVIGVSHYTAPGLPAVPTAANDARAVAKLLTDPDVCRFPSENVVLLTDDAANHTAIDADLSRVLWQAARGAELVLIYFAGHSFDGYLLPSDASPGYLAGSGIALTSLARRVSEVDAESVVVCLDCCHGLPRRRSDALRVRRFFDNELRERWPTGRQRFTLVACDEGQEAGAGGGPNSLFARYLLSGLQGAADRDGDGAVGVKELFEYVSENVARAARQLGVEQTPWFSAFGDTHLSTAVRRPEPAAPAFGPEAPPLTDPGVGDDVVSPPADAEFPRPFGRYELLGDLGRGGMGAVYRARPLAGGSDVALKVPLPHVADRPELRERFRREHRALELFRHPGLIPRLDAGEYDGTPYFTMPIIGGAPLGKKPVGRGAAARLVAAVADTMQHAHDRGVVHRNLQPDNILVRPDGKIVVIDFGIALVMGLDSSRALDAPEKEQIPEHARDWRPTSDFLHDRLTQPGAMMGTPAYMPPEQMSGSTLAIGPRTDVYALGVVLYRLLTGRLPFRGSVRELQEQILSPDPPPAPREFVPGLDPELNGVVLRALAKDPADRFPSMAALADALHPLADRLPDDAPPDAPGTLPGEPAEFDPHATDPGPTDDADRTAVRLPVPQPLPERVGRFEFLRRLGGGEFTSAYLAFDQESAREVALTVLFPGATAEQRDVFVRAARAATRIDHPNVCSVYDVVADDAMPHVASMYLPGGSLAERLRAGGPLPPGEAVRIARGIARGLAAAHAQGVVHRELKPSDVLFGADPNEPLVADFGLAQVGDAWEDDRVVRPEDGVYYSPEHLGEWREVGPLSDVYSLGLILYQMLTGELPFSGAPVAVLTARVVTPPEPPSARRPGLDPRLDAIVLKALAKSPADRYPSAEAFAEALAEYERTAAAALPADDPFARLPRDFGRYRLLGLRQVGEGDRFLVFDARDRSRDQPVAVVALTADAAPARRRVLADEVRILTRLSELGLRSASRLLDAGTIDGCEFYAAEAVAGPPIDGYWAENRGELGLAGLADLVARVATDLGAAHRAFPPGVLVHRNLCPRNIVVVPGRDGPRPVVLGFGLSLVQFPPRPSALDDYRADSLGYTGGPVGAFGYMPPEQMAAGPRDGGLTPQADVFSLGAVLYQLLTGELPYTGANSAEVAEAMLTTDFRPPGAFDPALAPFDPICRKAMARSLDNRYPSMTAFAADLMAFAARPPAVERAAAPGEPPATAPAGPPADPPPFGRSDVEGVTVLTLTDARLLAEERVQAVGDALLGVVREGRRPNVVLDLSRVELLSAATLGRLVALHRACLAAGGRLVVCAVSPGVLNAFKAVKLERVLSIAADAPAALREFGTGAPPAFQHIRLADEGGVAVVTFVRPFLGGEEHPAEAELLRVAGELGRRKVLLDLSTVTFPGSWFPVGCVALNRALLQAGGRLVVCGANKDIRDVFAITKMDKMLFLADTKEDALRRF